MRGVRSTVALIVVLGGLVAYIYFVESKRQPSSETMVVRDRVFADLTADALAELEVKGTSGETSSLRKSGDTWELSAPLSAKADETEISSFTSTLSSLEIQRVVEEDAAELSKYGLAPPRIEVAFRTQGDGPATRLLIGEKTATGGDLYAKLANAPRVFLVSGYLENTFDKKPFDFRQKAILTFERDKIDSLELTSGSTVVTAAKSGADWTLQKPWPVGAEYSALESIVTRLSSAQMRSIVAESTDDLKPYGLDRPVVTATVGAGSSRARVEIGATAAQEDQVYARDTSRPLVFTVDRSLADDLHKPASDFRRKDLFDFRPFNATRIEIARNDTTVVFEKTKGSGEDAQDKWRQTAPSAADVDSAKMDTVLSRFSSLRAQEFAPPEAPTGLSRPDATVTVQFDDGKKQERVMFGKVGETVYATKGEPAPAPKLDAKEYADALSAVDDALTKP